MNENTPEKIVERLRQTINKGKYGKDYTIIPRDKNNKLREEYIIDDHKIKTILLSLNIDDYIKTECSDNEDFPNDIVHFFTKEVSLIKRYSDKIEPQIIKLYIKFTWTKSVECGNLFFISFHKWDEK